MTLILQGTALNDEPLSQPLIGRFDERGGTVGRSESATFTLPDPQRLISRVQAQILYLDEGYWIESISAASSTLHNGRPLSAGMRVLLRAGDELRIGGYTLVAAFENDEVSASILRGRTSILPPPGSPGPRIAPTTAPLETQAWSERTLIRPSPGPLTDLNTTPGALAPAERQSLAERTAQADRQPPPERQALGDRQPHADRQSLSDRHAPGDRQPAANRQSPAELSAAQRPHGDEALWRAFLEGAGLELRNGALSPEFMKLVGTLLKIAIEGTHRLVTMRATTKEEIQAEMTRIQSRSNNPLKFAPDGTVALQFLLQPPVRGFLAGPTALQETMIDLQSHQVAMTAGMLSAVEAVLDRFDPSKVEALLTTQSVLDSFRPAHRRARLWELYAEHYRSLREDAQEAFKHICAEAFRKAYEEAQGRSSDAAHAASN